MTSLPDPLPCATTKVMALLGKVSAQTDEHAEKNKQMTHLENVRKHAQDITVS